jgi:mRNA interferase RelE/StbE
MAYRVLLRRSAIRELEHLHNPTQRRIARAIAALADDPRPPSAKLLSGPDRRWRIRVGDYRILHRIDDDSVVVVIVRVRHRKDAYA